MYNIQKGKQAALLLKRNEKAKPRSIAFFSNMKSNVLDKKC
jgi:hypothetical protein